MVQRALTVSLLLLAINSATMTGTPKSVSGSRGDELKAAFAELKANPDDQVAQRRYLQVFPHDYRRFLALFGAGGSLADGYQCDYIFALSPLQVGHSSEVGRLLVQLTKDAEYQADAPSCLQNVTATYASSYTKAFAGFLHALSVKECEQVITFLSDANVWTHPEYQRIIKNLKRLNESELVKQFQEAQIARSREPRS
ncbi:MAG: hypothetical protein WA738_13185 [Candidatus Angelobacter sp.]